jgi:hypothetical protein
MERELDSSPEIPPLGIDAPFRGPPAPVGISPEERARAERWHELLSTRYVCEACLTRYFMKYRKCKACGEVGRIRSLTASLLELADDDGELREMIANGQVFGVGSREPEARSQ